MTHPFYKKYFVRTLDKIRSEKRYRIFTELLQIKDKMTRATTPGSQKEVTVWCSNDYLGMSKHPVVTEAAIGAIDIAGVGAGGTRNISGNHSFIVDLEREIALLHKKEAALVFTSGYVANQAALGSLKKIMPTAVVFSDADNHASMIHGIQESKLEKRIFRHNDPDDLEMHLKDFPFELPKIIVFESVYSMSGDIAPFSEFCALAERYNAMLYVDEVHSVGLYGIGGAGMAEMLGFSDEMDVIQGTLGKAYGCIGGYIAADSVIIDAVRSVSPNFIFTTALPPPIVAAAKASITHLYHSDRERILHQQQVKKTRQALIDVGLGEYLLEDNGTHIVIIMVRDAEKSRYISQELLTHHQIYLQNINFPTVPQGAERLRITPNPHHSDDDIGHLANSLSAVWKKYFP